MEVIQRDVTLVISPVAKTTGLSNAMQRVSSYRLALGWLMLTFWLLSVLALDWDAEWHALVGRDGFWTPPHWMFYSTVTLCGLICLFEVLTETLLYYRHFPGITKTTTTPVLFVFRGPVGFILGGFGMVVMLISAPFDDYWHRIFGIDLAIWTPFHVMLVLGIIMANIGIIYLFASEVNRRQEQVERRPLVATSLWRQSFSYLIRMLQPATLGLVIATVLLVTRYLGLMAETFVGRGGIGTLTIGDNKLPAASLTMAALPIVLVMLVSFTGRIGLATLAGLIFVVFRVFDAAFSVWGIETLAIQRGFQLRDVTDTAMAGNMAYPVGFALAAIAVDIVFLLARWYAKSGRSLPKLLVAIAATAVGATTIFLVERPWEAFNAAVRSYLATSDLPLPVKFLLNGYIAHPDYWLALPVVLLIGIAGGVVARAFAVSLHYTER